MPSTSQNTEDNQDSLEQLKMELQGVIEKVWCTEDGAVWDKLMQGQPNGSLLKQLTEEVWQMKEDTLSALENDFYSSFNLDPSYVSNDPFD
ncbi:hypothetical protein LIER_43980 [Lithospermum erythrorhizon]|uniref:Uncharacterized protein n=1 Tax=Lithospermum erythrorhizon TaxID=34254 RepID=A0AAV3RDY9_LITER